MNPLIRTLAFAAVVTAFLVGTTTTQAQAPAPAPAPGRGRGNFDPAQMRQRMMDRYKEALEVTKDDEWKVLEPLIQKVLDTRMQAGMGGRGMFGGGRRGARGSQPDAANNNQNNQGGRRRGGPAPSPEAEDLQKAVDAKASSDDLKTKLAKLRDVRKAKQGELEQAQENLRKVLTVRQEAVAVLMGLLR
ncbi:MAG: hypothetical protein ACYDH9_15340 [Limisphaerales bacterium]